VNIPGPLFGRISDDCSRSMKALHRRRFSVTIRPSETSASWTVGGSFEPQLVHLATDGVLHERIRKQVEHYSAKGLGNERIHWVVHHSWASYELDRIGRLHCQSRHAAK